MNAPSLRHPGRWIWLVLLLPAVIGLFRLRFDAEVLNLLPPQLPAVIGLKLQQEHFTNSRELIITVQSDDPGTTEAAVRSIGNKLRKQTSLVAQALWEPPWLENPHEMAELIAYTWLNLEPKNLEQLAARLEPSRASVGLQQVREELATTLSPGEMARMSYDPFGFTRFPDEFGEATPSLVNSLQGFGSEDGRFRVIFVEAAHELPTYRECDQWLVEVKQVVLAGAAAAGLRTQPGYTGRPVFVSEIARGMERDMRFSVAGTAVIIAVLFWIAHRRIKPMLWLLTLLGAVLVGTVAMGGLLFGAINVVSMGFAAILLGLAVDYAVVHYQEAVAQPHLSVPQIRRAIAPSIFWAALTTIAAFLTLNFGGLPGLSQLGTLVAVGVTLAAFMMVFEYLPPLFPDRREARWKPATLSPEPLGVQPIASSQTGLALVAVGVLVCVVTVVLGNGFPAFDPSSAPLRPRDSQAYRTLEEMQQKLVQTRDPLWVVIAGSDEREVRNRLQHVKAILSTASSNGVVGRARLPDQLWPWHEAQAQNRTTALELLSRRETLRTVALTNGFAESAFGLADAIFDTWQTIALREGVYWPTGQASRWIFSKFAGGLPRNQYAIGLVEPLPRGVPEAALAWLNHQLAQHHAWLSGWELLGRSVFVQVRANLWKLITPMVVLVLVSLCLAFRNLSMVALGLAVMTLSGLSLLSLMRMAGWSWNLLNLMSIPLVLGTGVDYSLFMLLALRRFHGDVRAAYRSVGRALLLCGGTAVAGFGSLAWSSNAGMASLGKMCAAGIALNMLLAVFLLPALWQRWIDASDLASQVSRPSSLYRAEVWRACLWLVKALPVGLSHSLARALSNVYWTFARKRRQVVVQNVLPIVANNLAAARRTADRLSVNFSRKLIDLWRYEAGLSIGDLLGPTVGWEYYEHAGRAGRGILLVTPHLGNWEFGGARFTHNGDRLQVISLAEPGHGLTALRKAARARWNIDTIVIGEDAFAFLEIIRKLDNGATVALLIDRPHPATAVEVEFFGLPFQASLAAAEFARASGCAVLPVYVVRLADYYGAYMLPEVPYDRARLRDRDERRRFTQNIMRALEPAVIRHLDQWYHFVPVWPEPSRSVK
jgi:predicted exporter/lauroyl/myristoyl acyltransferase